MKEEIKKRLPKIKRDIKEFVSDERGLVSKDKILKLGFALGVGSLLLSNTAGAQTNTYHHNSFSGGHNSGGTVSGSHTHAFHSHHSSHSSY